MAFGTADIALRVRARLKPGQTLLVSGAGGGVGLAAGALGVAAGAKVVALASGEAKAGALRALGAAAVIDPRALPPGCARLRDAIKARDGVEIVSHQPS